MTRYLTHEQAVEFLTNIRWFAVGRVTWTKQATGNFKIRASAEAWSYWKDR